MGISLETGFNSRRIRGLAPAPRPRQSDASARMSERLRKSIHMRECVHLVPIHKCLHTVTALQEGGKVSEEFEGWWVRNIQ